MRDLYRFIMKKRCIAFKWKESNQDFEFIINQKNIDEQPQGSE